MALYPVFLALRGLPVVIVGGGNVAAGKLAGLLEAGAEVTVVAPEIVPTIRARAGSGGAVTLTERAFTPTDLDGARGGVAAATAAVNREVAAAAASRGLFVNAVDDPAAATAYLGGVVRRGGVTVALSTGGDAPALAGLLREALDQVLPEDLDAWLEVARVARRQWRTAAVPMAERRPLLLRALVARYGGTS